MFSNLDGARDRLRRHQVLRHLTHPGTARFATRPLCYTIVAAACLACCFCSSQRTMAADSGGCRHKALRAGATLSKGQIELRSCISLQVKAERCGSESRTPRDMHADVTVIHGGCKPQCKVDPRRQLDSRHLP